MSSRQPPQGCGFSERRQIVGVNASAAVEFPLRALRVLPTIIAVVSLSGDERMQGTSAIGSLRPVSAEAMLLVRKLIG
jgi:hypothetical protein